MCTVATNEYVSKGLLHAFTTVALGTHNAPRTASNGTAVASFSNR